MVKVKNVLLVKQDPDQTYIPAFAKINDSGLDLPVKLTVNKEMFAKVGKSPRHLRKVMIGIEEKNPQEKHIEIPPENWAEIPSGISVKIPDNAWGAIFPRSSSVWKKKLLLSPGCIDSGYTGLLGVLVYNPNSHPVIVYEYDPENKTGDKLGQLILIPKYDLKDIVVVDELPNTYRQESGFGSSDLER